MEVVKKESTRRSDLDEDEEDAYADADDVGDELQHYKQSA